MANLRWCGVLFEASSAGVEQRDGAGGGTLHNEIMVDRINDFYRATK